VIKFFDLSKQQKIIKKSLDHNIKSVLKNNKYIQGLEVYELEKKLSQFVLSKNCITNASGTDSLLLALMAIGIKKGDEVITSPFSFVSAVESIILLGARPIFVDINLQTFNIDESKIESAITKKTKAIIPVSLFGQIPNFDIINLIAKKFNIIVIEDAAQSLGSIFKNKYSCNLSTIACTSFFPTKPLGCYGDGGACFTNNKILAKKIKDLSLHGKANKKFYYNLPGINSRLDTIQASILLSKLEIFKKEIRLRQKVAKNYDRLFKGCENNLTIPFINSDCTSVYAQYTIKAEKRDKLRKYLLKFNIPTIIYYPFSLNKLKYLKNKQTCPVSELVVKKVLSLPFDPYLSLNKQKFIVNKIKSFYKNENY